MSCIVCIVFSFEFSPSIRLLSEHDSYSILFSSCFNVSATVSLKKNDWDHVGEWMWENRKHYNGLSVLPYDGGTYTQAPFEDITEQEFNKRVKLLNDVDLSMIVETTDETDLSGELACAGGVCEITSL